MFLGPVHGALFVIYILLALYLWRKNKWSGRTLAVVDSVLPTGGFWVARRTDLKRRVIPVVPVN